MKKSNNLATIWTQGMSPDRKEDFVKHVFNQTSLPVLRRLKEILKLELEQLTSNELTTQQYEIGGWPYLQAHRNGQRQALTKLLDLLTFVE